jgi:hypothetical protein
LKTWYSGDTFPEYYEDCTEYDFMKVLDMDPQASDAIIQTLLDHPLESGLLPMSVDKREKNIII